MSHEKNKTEEEYFARLEREARERASAEAEIAREAARLAELAALHRQRCGKCGGLMKPQDYKGVEIDVCEGCGAVLLDPGELEQLAGNDASGTLAGLASLFKFRAGK